MLKAQQQVLEAGHECELSHCDGGSMGGEGGFGGLGPFLMGNEGSMLMPHFPSSDFDPNRSIRMKPFSPQLGPQEFFTIQ